jgi:Rap1a immunity proteins
VLQSAAMKNITFIIAAVLSVMFQGGGVQKQDKVLISISDITGNDLLEHCSSHEPFELNFCTGYIEGVRDGLMFAAVRLKSEPFFSVPNEAKSEQVKDIVVKYLRDNPETRHKPAGMLTFLALEKAFSR